MDELKASLLAHGLMQNLVVTDAGDGTFRVIAGGRRLAAIHALQAEGKLPEDFAVPCQVVTEEHALEMSLAENTVRLAMHPADQFEAFAALIDKGETAAEVAQRFGVEESLVLKRMKLARVAPQLLKEYRSDGMTLECLMAYTITDDHRRQLKVFKSLQDWQKDDPERHPRRSHREDDRGRAASWPVSSGWTPIRRPAAPPAPTCSARRSISKSPPFCNKLAEEKLAGIRKELEAEGWGWIEINPERDYEAIYRCEPAQADAGRSARPSCLSSRRGSTPSWRQRSKPLRTRSRMPCSTSRRRCDNRLDEVEQKLAGFVGFDAEQKKLAGCFVSIGQDGTPFLDKGLVKPEHRKQLAKLLKADGSDGEPAR